MKAKAEVQAKVEVRHLIGVHRITLALTLALTSLGLLGCNRTDETGASSAATPTPRIAAPEPTEVQSRIETGVVAVSPAKPALTLVGKIAYGEDRYSRISSPVQGRVLDVRAKLGDHVKTGDVLLAIDSPDITAAYSEFVKEASELEYATRAYELAKDLYETKALPQKDLKHAENDLIKARAEFRRTKERLLSLKVPVVELEKPLSQQRITSRFELKSPLSGTVVERTVTPGQSVGGDYSQVLFTVADLDTVQVVADVYERDLDLVKVGQLASVAVEAYQGVGFPAVIAAIGDVVDPNSHTIKVRAWVNNEARKLKPEMFARLNIEVGDGTSFITVPKEAVLEVDGKDFVYVAESDGRYVKHPVKIGTATGDEVRVLEGLTAGDRIVTKGAVFLKAQEAKG
jgi:cobalt-zinc-cadmium efflux system membrane fusion protein